uniref:McrB family protein n=1 Tax=Candidatus Ruminimicrobium bovinum TaxID=3242779 RepID=UPI0039B980A7
IFEFRLMHKYLCVVYPTLFLHWHIKEKFKEYMKILKLDDYNNIFVVEKYFWDKYKNNIENLNMKEETKKLEQQLIEKYQGDNIEKISYLDSIIKAIKQLGGQAPLLKIYNEVRYIRSEANQKINDSHEATIRGVIETHSSDSKKWTKKEKDNIFKKVEEGIWALREGIFKDEDIINDNVNENINVSESNIDDKIINQPLNQILYGPPGTGKTYSTKNLVNNIIENQTISKDKSCKFITFHQSYSYEEFIEGIKPIVDGSNKDLKYEIANGIFKELCLEANKDKENKYVLVIDEINRGNISKIFGELITLIEDDKRVEPNGEDDFENTQVKDNELLVTLPYSKQKFGVPKNLYIIGTMNTSDRSIASVDIALRRRFKFIEMMPKGELVTNISIGNTTFQEIFEALNEKITILLDRDHQIGHSYFIKDKFKPSNGEELNNESKIEVLKNIWFDEILPLLNEYFYNDWYKLQALLGEAELKKDNNEKNSSFIVKSDLSKYKMKDIDKEDKFIFNFVDRDKVDFQQALLKSIELVKNNAENKEVNSNEQENN